MDSKGTVIRLQMDETLSGLTGKLGELEHQVSATVRSVKDSVNSVRDTVDLKLQVRQRPWSFMAGAAAIGFLGGYRPNNHQARKGNSDGPVHTRESAKYIDSSPDIAKSPAANKPGWLANLGESFRPEIAELKGILIGTLIGVAREIVTNQLPRSMERGAGSGGSDSLETQDRRDVE